MDQDTEANLPFKVGDTLAGKYRIDRVLGVGGMGVVVAATHLDLDTKVAIKVMRDELLSDESSVQRLLLEARSASKIRSEHVARVLDVSRLPGGAPYIVMEFLEGCDLGQMLAESGPLPVSQAVDFLLEACEALAEAHAAQIIHRDLKPENLFVSRRADGSPSIKVVDFGISKQLGASASGRALTNPSTAVGSPQYMAPEQMQARPVDVRADVWALGAILYQSVSGTHAFDGQTLPEVCAKVLGQDPPLLRSLRPGLPDELEAIVLCCLKKDPNQRYANVASFATALAPLGSAAAQRSLERISRVLKGSGALPSKHIEVTGPTVAVVTTPLTGSATYNNTPAQGTAKTSRWLAPTLAVGAIVLIGILILALRETPPDGHVASPSPVPPTPVAAKEDPPPKVTDPPPAASAEPVAIPSATPSATAAVPTPPTATSEAKATRPTVKPKRAPAPKSPNTQEAWDPNSFGGRR